MTAPGLPGIYNGIGTAWRQDFASPEVGQLLHDALNAQPVITSSLYCGHDYLPKSFRARILQLQALRTQDKQLARQSATEALHMTRELCLAAHVLGFPRDKVALLELVVMAEDLCEQLGGPLSELRQALPDFEKFFVGRQGPGSWGVKVLDSYFCMVDTMHTRQPEEGPDPRHP
ncbi:unnamed protein product [Diplocarpon coronariae]